MIALPDPLAESDWLSPWAVATRYDDVDEPLDDSAALDVAQIAIDWAAAQITRATS